MIFKLKPPLESGNYWFVDVDYPVPQIGFFLQPILYYGATEYDFRHDFTQKHIAIGDIIRPPKVELDRT